jgi:hypothetical protein
VGEAGFAICFSSVVTYLPFHQFGLGGSRTSTSVYYTQLQIPNSIGESTRVVEKIRSNTGKGLTREENLAALAKLPNIKSLKMVGFHDYLGPESTHNGLTAMITAWQHKLEVLFLFGIGFFRLSLKAMLKCSKLSTLGLRDCGLTPEGLEPIIAGCSLLKYADLSRNRTAFENGFPWKEH